MFNLCVLSFVFGIITNCVRGIEQNAARFIRCEFI